jgi:hypothetical protein
VSDGAGARELLVTAATLREFLARTAGTRVVAVLDRGADDGPLLLDCVAGEAVQVTDGEREFLLGECDYDTAPLALPDLRPLPPFAIDAARAEITAPLGALAYIAGAVRDLAALLHGRSVVTAEFLTEDDEVPLLIAARTGEPLVLALGEEQFAMPVGWP